MRSLIGALMDKASAPAKTPVPLVSRAQSGLFGAYTRQRDVTEQLAAMEAIGTVFAIVDRIATSVSLVDWKLWRPAKSGLKEERTEVTSHWALDVWNRPNSFMTRQELVETEQQHQELTGEGWTVVGRNPRARALPLELWPVRPDRMEPIPSAEAFLKGYLYRSPDGEMVPLERDDVLFIRRPNPNNPYRGLGPIQSILVDIDSTRAAAEWNRNFFLNSAEPGGIVEVEKRLSDDEFDEMVERWREQHQGVAKAHRVAILEQAKWVDRKYTMREMQFAELRGVTSAAIREAFGFPKFMTGEVTDVNRANAEASEAMFAKWLIVPRLERWKQMLNYEFLPLFGATAVGLEFDYESPVPENSEAENAARTSQSNAAVAMVGAGWDPDETLEVMGLPAIKFVGPPQPPVPPGGGFPAKPGAKPKDDPFAVAVQRLLAQAPEIDPALALVQADWETALETLLAEWQQVSVEQRARLREQIRAAVEAGNAEALSGLAVPSDEGAELLAAALVALLLLSGRRMSGELAAQGAPDVEPALADAVYWGEVAATVAALLAAGLAAAAGREALRLMVPGVSAADVVAGVDAFLAGMSDRGLRDALGGALTRAQNVGRLETVKDVPQVLYFATETLDGNTCKPCESIDGHQFADWFEAWTAYAGGQYRACLGRDRCRGTVKAKWNPEAGS